MLFIAIDKNTHQIGLFDCSPNFYKSGKEKVQKASELYDLFYKDENFDHKQHLTNNNPINQKPWEEQQKRPVT